jgi:hypothetical protein
MRRKSAGRWHTLFKLQQNDGGTAVTQGAVSDPKSTAVAVIIGTAVGGDRDWIREGVDWLLSAQKNEGDWPRGNLGAINATFYVISALFSHLLRSGDSAVVPAIKKAIYWYKCQSGFVLSNGKVGWAWPGVEETSAAISVLLSTTDSIESADIQKGLEWLLAKCNTNGKWGADTPIATMALIRCVDPETNLSNKLREFDPSMPKFRKELDEMMTVHSMKKKVTPP